MNTFFSVSKKINQRKESRLIGDVDKVRNQIFTMKQEQSANQPTPAFIEYVEKGLEQVVETSKTDNDLAWRNFKTLRRMLIQGFNKDQCLAEIKYLLGSSVRISGWQQTTIAGLFPTDYESLPLDTLQTKLQSATEIKDEYFDDEYNRFYTSQIYLTRILYIFVIAISLFTLIYSIGVNFLKLNCFLGSPKYIIAFEVFGFLGAVFSVVTRFTSSTSTQENINSLQYESSPLLRTSIGPGAALIMYLFIQSQVINPSFFKLSDAELSNDSTKTPTVKKTMIDTSTHILTVAIKIDSLKKNDSTKTVAITKVAVKPNIIKVADCTDCTNIGITPSYLMFILAFLAGFSEKLVVQILNKLSDKVK